MSPSYFLDKSAAPDEISLAAALTPALPLWQHLLKFLRENLPAFSSEWKIYTAKSGWTLVVKDRKRTILYMTPQAGWFTTDYIFGDRAVAAVEASELPMSIKQALREARKYMEGRGIVVEARDEDDLRNVEVLVRIKLAS